MMFVPKLEERSNQRLNPFQGSLRSSTKASRLITGSNPTGEQCLMGITTGSMEEKDGTSATRMERARQALDVLAGADDSITGRFARFDDRELVTILTFSESVEHKKTYQMTLYG